MAKTFDWFSYFLLSLMPIWVIQDYSLITYPIHFEIVNDVTFPPDFHFQQRHRVLRYKWNTQPFSCFKLPESSIISCFLILRIFYHYLFEKSNYLLGSSTKIPLSSTFLKIFPVCTPRNSLCFSAHGIIKRVHSTSAS